MNRINQIINEILLDYFPVLNISEDKFSNMESKFVELESLLKEAFQAIPTLEIKKHTQTGGRASIPWIGFRLIDGTLDSKPQTGVYLTILFKADGSGVVLSLQHGVDKLKSSEIPLKIKDLRNLIPDYPEFIKGKLNLKTEILKSPSRPKKYEIANLIGKDYDYNNIKEITSDLENLIHIY